MEKILCRVNYIVKYFLEKLMNWVDVVFVSFFFLIIRICNLVKCFRGLNFKIVVIEFFVLFCVFE